MNTTIGAYELLRKLAAGGTSEVFLAQHRSTGEFVAIKRLFANYVGNASMAAMFRHESSVLAALDHPVVPRLLESGVFAGCPYLVMEHVAGIAAADFVRDGVPPFVVAIATVASLLSGLQHAHEREDHRGQPLQIVHRDVTPANVLVTRDGDVKLIDFGIATSALRPDEVDGAARGTAGYMAAEVITGLGGVDARADVFSAGAMLYELTVGTRAFGGNNLQAMHAVVDGEYELPTVARRGYPRVLEKVIVRALGKTPDERFESAAAMHEAIEQAATAIGSPISNDALADWVRARFPESDS